MISGICTGEPAPERAGTWDATVVVVLVVEAGSVVFVAVWASVRAPIKVITAPRKSVMVRRFKTTGSKTQVVCIKK